MPATSADVVVLGGGPAGVAAAWWAARRGCSVVLLERSARVGGLAGSFEVAGQRVDLGSHRLHPDIDAGILAVLTDLLGSDLQLRRRNGRIRLGGAWLKFPLSPTDLLRNAPRGLALGFGRDLITSPMRSPRADTFAEQVRAGPGPTIARHFYDPYARKLFGVDPADLSGDLFRRRVSASSSLAIAARALRGSGGSAAFMSPRRGFGQISEAMAGAAVDAGADVRLGAAATSVEPRAGAARVGVGDQMVDTKLVLSSIPAPALVRLMGSEAPERVRSAAAALSYRRAALVYLILDVPQFSPFDATYLPEPTTPVTRLSEPKNYRDNPDDPSDTTVLCAEVPYSPGDDVDQADDELLANRVIESLSASGLTVDPAATRVVRVDALYPIYTLDYGHRIRTVEQWFDDDDLPIVPFGRQALFAHDNTHHGLAMAKAAVESIRPDGSFDHRVWETSKAIFQFHTVAD